MRSTFSTPRTAPEHRSPVAPRGPAPAPTAASHRFDVFRVLLGVLLALVLSAFVASSSLVDIAERMEFGPERDRWLYAARTVDDASHNLWLDRPGDWIRDALGYTDTPDGVIIGELARRDEPEPSSAPAVVPEPVAAGDDDSADEPLEADPGAEPTASGTPADAGENETVEPVTNEGTPTGELRAVDAAEPLRVWLGGDSLGQYIASHLAYRIAPPEQTDITLDYHISTGLARPDYFDWPAHFTELAAAEQPPEALVYMIGGNDDQPMRLQDVVLDPMTPEWREEYGRRVALLMDVVAYSDTRLIWILLPPMESDRRSAISSDINAIIAAQAAQRPWVVAVDIRDLFVDENGRYAQFVDSPDGNRELARQNDGVHITEVGSRWVADLVWEEIAGLWPTVDGATTGPGDSAANGP